MKLEDENLQKGSFLLRYLLKYRDRVHQVTKELKGPSLPFVASLDGGGLEMETWNGWKVYWWGLGE